MIFGGTTEARKLLERLGSGLEIIYCAATQYGAEIVNDLASNNIKILSGRLDADGMKNLIQAEEIACVIDATHPYAVEVSKNIKAVCDELNLPLMCVTRQDDFDYENLKLNQVSSAREAAELLNNNKFINQNILLATGSKELKEFINVKNYKERIYARVLPVASVLKSCEELGFNASHIIAMQGPFSYELNISMLKAYNCGVLVTKATGTAGGEDEKINAARDLGIEVILISRPDLGEEIHSVDEGAAWARKILNLERPPMFPMLIDIEGRDVLVVGGGKIALRRVKTLLKCGASIRVVSPELNSGFESIKNNIKIFKRKFEIKDLDNAMLAVAASDDREANKLVGQEAKARNIPVSVADAIAECTFFFPALIASGAASVSVSTAGTSYHTTKRLADRLRSVWARWVAEESEAESESDINKPVRKIKIGSRASALAVAQSNLIIEAITKAHPEIEVELIIMQTTGDVNMKPFADITDPTGIKGLFTLELENALLNGDIDLAIHSLKDVPMKLNEKLPIVAYSKREDPRDALVINNKDGNIIGCSSLRRRLQLAKIFPDKQVLAVRGNLQTRLKKLESGEFDMLVLAASGLKRLGLGDKIGKYFEVDEMIPSAGQGVLACQGRAGEDYYYLDAIIDKDSQDCAIAERAFATALGGGCTQPVAAHAVIKADNNLELTGLYIEMRDNNINIYHKKVLTGSRSDAETIGRNLAAQIMREFKR